MPSDVPSVPPVARRDVSVSVTVYPAGVHGTLDGLPTRSPVVPPARDEIPPEGAP